MPEGHLVAELASIRDISPGGNRQQSHPQNGMLTHSAMRHPLGRGHKSSAVAMMYRKTFLELNTILLELRSPTILSLPNSDSSGSRRHQIAYYDANNMG